MSAVAFDTLKYAEKLEKAGFSRPQAIAQAEAQADILTNLLEERVTTKKDLKETERCLKTDIQGTANLLKADIQETKHLLTTDIRATEHRLETKIQETEHRLETKIQGVKEDLEKQIYQSNRWLTSLLLSSVGLLALYMSLLKFLV